MAIIANLIPQMKHLNKSYRQQHDSEEHLGLR